jgi:hypothetical protein
MGVSGGLNGLLVAMKLILSATTMDCTVTGNWRQSAPIQAAGKNKLPKPQINMNYTQFGLLPSTFQWNMALALVEYR